MISTHKAAAIQFEPVMFEKERNVSRLLVMAREAAQSGARLIRPKHRMSSMGMPWALPADLSLIWWLENSGLDYEILTDHDLHAEGIDALRPYRTVITARIRNMIRRRCWTRPRTISAPAAR